MTTTSETVDPTHFLTVNAPYTMPMGLTCAVHKHDSWVPMEKHHILPQAMGGPSTKENLLTVCCNGHYAIHEFMRQLTLTGGQVPWEQARHYGAKVREYATRGWEQSGSPKKAQAPLDSSD